MSTTALPAQTNDQELEPDVERYGAYTVTRAPGDTRPVQRFGGRLIADAVDAEDGPDRFVARPGRFHLYAGWFCPWAHRATLVIALAGLEEAVSVSYVSPGRDARGWSFRGATGPDLGAPPSPLGLGDNGFGFLRDAYEATEPGFDGHVSVPTLWDRQTGRIASNDYATLDADLATAFPSLGNGTELYPADLRGEIDELDAWLRPAVNHGAHRAASDVEARAGFVSALDTLEGRLTDQTYLLGDRLTVADLRLWVTLVRWDVGTNAGGTSGPRLAEKPALWRWARALYQRDAVRGVTDLSAFTTPGAVVPDWEAAPTKEQP